MNHRMGVEQLTWVTHHGHHSKLSGCVSRMLYKPHMVEGMKLVQARSTAGKRCHHGQSLNNQAATDGREEFQVCLGTVSHINWGLSWSNQTQSH
jgi:hypothetical protein